MSSNFGRRLYTSFWEAANPFLGRSLWASRTPHFYDTATNSNNIICDLLFKRQTRKISSVPPRKTTQITRRFASGSFLVLGISPNSTAVETGTTCAVAPEKIISHVTHRIYKFDRRLLHGSSRNASPHRGSHTSKDDLPKMEARMESLRYSNESSWENVKSSEYKVKKNANSKQDMSGSQQPGPSTRHLIDRLPHMPQLHRPTKEELLAAANGFWSRLKVRFKWFSIRSVRPFNLDEITALFSWVLLGHVVWVVLGTTTFFSLLIIAINTVFAQGMFMVWMSVF